MQRLVGVGVFLLTVSPAAAVVAYDGFNYGVGSGLGGQTNLSTGATWVYGSAGADILVSVSSLSVEAGRTGPIASGSGRSPPERCTTR
jgi:hypothetical protein